jgi:hypothetical protein
MRRAAGQKLKGGHNFFREIQIRVKDRNCFAEYE